MRHMDADDNPLILTLMTDRYPRAAHPHLVLTHPGMGGRVGALTGSPPPPSPRHSPPHPAESHYLQMTDVKTADGRERCLSFRVGAGVWKRRNR